MFLSITDRLVQMAYNYDDIIQGKSSKVMKSVARNYPVGHSIVFEFLDEHWDDM